MTDQEIVEFYKLSCTDVLTKKSDETCRSHYGDRVWIRGLIEFSNHCVCDCAYCGIRKSNRSVKRYRLTEDDIIRTVRDGQEVGIRTFVLQSGEDAFFSIKRLCRIVERVKNILNDNDALTLSCGKFSRNDYRELKKAGADRYLMRFETSDKNLYSSMKNGEPLSERLAALSDLKDLGYETGSGFLVGLPGETDEIRINNALLCKKLGLDMVGIGPFIPHPETPLKNAPQESIEWTFRAIALVRLLLPKANIPATTAAGSLDPQGREKALAAGANVLMPNLTPVEHKKDYLLYPGKICLEESGLDCLGCLSLRVKQAGKRIDMGTGHALSFNNIARENA